MLITEKDVGRRVLHRDGAESTITGWDDSNLFTVKTTHPGKCFTSCGGATGWPDHPEDIIAFADEKERTMKHVIAGEAQEDVLEWKLMINAFGQVFINARPRGVTPWKEVVRVDAQGIINVQYGRNHQDLGLKLAE